MAPHSTLSTGVQAISDAEQLRMPGHDTRSAGGVVPTPPRERFRTDRTWLSPRAWLAQLRRPAAQVTH